MIEEAGGKVTDIRGKPLDFSIGRLLTANTGVIATNGIIHDEVIAVSADLGIAEMRLIPDRPLPRPSPSRRLFRTV